MILVRAMTLSRVIVIIVQKANSLKRWVILEITSFLFFILINFKELQKTLSKIFIHGGKPLALCFGFANHGDAAISLFTIWSRISRLLEKARFCGASRNSRPFAHGTHDTRRGECGSVFTCKLCHSLVAFCRPVDICDDGLNILEPPISRSNGFETLPQPVVSVCDPLGADIGLGLKEKIWQGDYIDLVLLQKQNRDSFLSSIMPNDYSPTIPEPRSSCCPPQAAFSSNVSLGSRGLQASSSGPLCS